MFSREVDFSAYQQNLVGEKMMRKKVRKYLSLKLVLIKTLAGFAPKLHLFERFSDLSSGLDCKGGISRLSQGSVYYCLCLRIYAASAIASTDCLYLSQP